MNNNVNFNSFNTVNYHNFDDNKKIEENFNKKLDFVYQIFTSTANQSISDFPLSAYKIDELKPIDLKIQHFIAEKLDTKDIKLIHGMELFTLLENSISLAHQGNNQVHLNNLNTLVKHFINFYTHHNVDLDQIIEKLAEYDLDSIDNLEIWENMKKVQSYKNELDSYKNDTNQTILTHIIDEEIVEDLEELFTAMKTDFPLHSEDPMLEKMESELGQIRKSILEMVKFEEGSIDLEYDNLYDNEEFVTDIKESFEKENSHLKDSFQSIPIVKKYIQLNDECRKASIEVNKYQDYNEDILKIYLHPFMEFEKFLIKHELPDNFEFSYVKNEEFNEILNDKINTQIVSHYIEKNDLAQAGYHLSQISSKNDVLDCLNRLYPDVENMKTLAAGVHDEENKKIVLNEIYKLEREDSEQTSEKKRRLE